MINFKKSLLLAAILVISTQTIMPEESLATIQKSDGVFSAAYNYLTTKWNSISTQLDKSTLKIKEDTEASFEQAATSIANHKKREWEAEAYKHEHGGLYDTMYCYYCRFMAQSSEDKTKTVKTAVASTALCAVTVYAIYWLYKKSNEKPNLEEIEKELDNDK